MIKLFYGENRQQATKDIAKYLGPDYEVIEGTNIIVQDMPSIFLGNSLFSSNRSILIRDLSANKEAFSELHKYLDTPHKIIILESKLDKRLTAFKDIKDQIEIKEYVMPRDPNAGLVFDIYHTAKKDGKKAIAMLEKIKPTQDPMMFFGLIVTQATKDYAAKQGSKEKSALKALSKLDMNLKTTPLQSWPLIESFLLQVSSL